MPVCPSPACRVEAALTASAPSPHGRGLFQNPWLRWRLWSPCALSSRVLTVGLDKAILAGPEGFLLRFTSESCWSTRSHSFVTTAALEGERPGSR